MVAQNPKDKVGRTKLPLWLLPTIGIIEGVLAQVAGAIKYSPYNWRFKPISANEYISALDRHVQKYKNGEDYDQDDKVKHLGCIIATASIMLDAELHGTLIDDRPKSNFVNSDLFNEYRQHPVMLLLQEKGYAELPPQDKEVECQTQTIAKRILEPEFNSYPPMNSN